MAPFFFRGLGVAARYRARRVGQQRLYLAWWADRLCGVDLRRASLRDHVLPALRRATAKPQRIAVLKVLYSWLRTVQHTISTAEDPTLGQLAIPQAKPAQLKRSKVVPRTHLGDSTSPAYVPPPPEEVPRLLGELEQYIHGEDRLPPIVRAGLVHVQFETIHPYLDGNGRVGRLLIALLLEHWKLLGAPLLYLSLHFKRRRPDYYRLLNEVRQAGAWEEWTAFFLQGVADVAEESADTARDLYRLVARDRERVLVARGSSLTAVRLLDQLPRHPIVTIPRLVAMLETTKPTAAKSVALLESLWILQETTGRKRDRAYRYSGYLDRLRTGTELIRAERR